MRKRGSIRGRGEHYEIRLDLGRVDGKRRSRSVAFKGSYKAAQKELSRLLAAADAGTLTDPSTMTVGEYVGHYLASTLTQSGKLSSAIASSPSDRSSRTWAA
jgi:hypothetical protein